MKTKKIVIAGGPSTGKSSIINELIARKHKCFEEISRQVILEARKNGDEQLFLTQPLLFSKLLLEGRKQQFLDAELVKKPFTFLDRGTPDVIAYMDYVKESYPDYFVATCKATNYDMVFMLEPWKDIYQQDNERYETFEQAEAIHKCLVNTYKRFGYDLITVPFGSVTERCDFILNCVKNA